MAAPRPQRVGDTVLVHGVKYRVHAVHDLGHLGSKFFGKRAFDLTNETGTFRTIGRAVRHNSRLTEVETSQ